VVVDSATQVTATWKDGVPTVSSASEKAILSFTKNGIIDTFYAISTQTLANAITVTSSTADLKCSFEGGCKYEVISTAGLTTLLKNSPADNYINICEKKCELVASDSVSGTTVCKVPSVSTTYSNENFKIEVPSESLNSGVYFGNNGDSAKLAFDNQIITKYESDSKVCYVGMQFKLGYVGMLEQVKFFLKEIPNRISFVYNL
jgi:hypothetical protein